MAAGAGFTAGLPAPVTVKVQVVWVFAGLSGLFELEPRTTVPPQAVRLPSAAITARTPTIDNHLRRRAGIPIKMSNARAAPPFAASHVSLLPSPGRTSAAVAPGVLTVRVAVAIAAPESRVTAELVAEQVGKSVAAEEVAVSEQASVTVPA